MNDLSNAAKALSNVSSTSAVQSADDMARAFELAGERISDALGKAASSGKLSFEDMAENVAQSLARLAISELFVNPLQDAFDSLGQKLTSGSATNMNINMNVKGTSNTSATFSNTAGQISNRLARAVRDGQGYM